MFSEGKHILDVGNSTNLFHKKNKLQNARKIKQNIILPHNVQSSGCGFLTNPDMNRSPTG